MSFGHEFSTAHHTATTSIQMLFVATIQKTLLIVSKVEMRLSCGNEE